MKAAAVEDLPGVKGLDEVLAKPLLFLGGKGGVGKTTMAAALALALARRHPERSVCLLSTDPAHSLCNVLGADRPLSGQFPNLKVLELKAESVFDEFKQRHRAGFQKIILRGTFLDEADLQYFLDVGLPGLDELAALKVIADTLKAGLSDQLIVDTAPTGHTLRLLALPEVLSQWREALNAMLAKHRLMSSLYARQYAPDEADALIAELQEIRALFRNTVRNARQAAFVVVLNPDPLAWQESKRLLATLRKDGIEVPCVLLNQIVTSGEACAVCAQMGRRQAQWRDKARAELQCRLVEIPRLPVEPRGVAALAALGESLLAAEAPEGAPPDDYLQNTPLPAVPATVRGNIVVPAPALRALRSASAILVCGKGGVGKTTVACALALHLARITRGRVLLFSTDPAHSISDALGTPLGTEPRPVAAGLDAIESNPERRWQELRSLHRQEINSFFNSMFQSEGVTTALDREAMARLIELSPPGLDEIMALAELSRYVQGKVYDKFVVDTPPAGHFLRFLELPGVMRGWLRAMFAIFLKYGRRVQMPRLQALLVQLSQDIKTFETLLRNAENTLVLPVAIPTQLALDQTRDLLTQTRRLGINTRVGVLNHMVWRGAGCPECARRAAQSGHFLTQYQQTFPGVDFLRLEEQLEDVTGIPELQRIGGAMLQALL